MDTAAFVYELPPQSIAQSAIEPRDSARMLVLPGLSDRRVSDLPRLLDPGDVVVVNSTKVRSARLEGTKEATEGAVELLLLHPLEGRDWRAMCRPARRLKAGTVLEFGAMTAELLTSPDDGIVDVRFAASVTEVEALLPEVGQIPMPPYFRATLVDAGRYQTMFARRVGSAAAPTAGLHFTERLVAGLKERGVAMADIDLEVGVDTFRPISETNLEDHVMHSERFNVPQSTADAVATAAESGNRVIAVGTTVVRTLESVATGDGTMAVDSGRTRLFITPGFRFRVVDAVLTNFHAPGTTLTVLAAALIGVEWRSAYEAALAREYRFLSFGDAMFVDEVRGA